MKTRILSLVLASILLIGQAAAASGESDDRPGRPRPAPTRTCLVQLRCQADKAVEDSRSAYARVPTSALRWPQQPGSRYTYPVTRTMPSDVFDLRSNSSDRGRRSLLEPVIYTAGFQAVGMGILLSMDPEKTGFEPARARNVIRGLTRPPVWDQDGWFTNYVAHPLWGSETYLRAREAHFSPIQAFLFSTAASVGWEYLVEAWAEHPSTQDLLFTSTFGSVFGEVRYQALRSLQRQDAWWARILEVAVDPLGALLRHTILLSQRLSGSLAASILSDPVLTPGETGSLGEPPTRLVGLQFTMKF